MNAPFPDPAAEKLQLEVERLRLEIAGLQRRGWREFLQRNASLLTAAIAVTGIVAGLYQFNRGQNANREQMKIQSDRDEQGRKEALDKAYWEEQNRVYALAADAAGRIAAAKSLDEVQKETRDFWTLYWGRMSLLENRGVERSMVAFGKLLEEWQRTHSKPSAISGSSYQLAHCMRESLAQTWRPANGNSVRDDHCPAD